MKNFTYVPKKVLLFFFFFFAWNVPYLTCQSFVEVLISPWCSQCFCVEMGWAGAYLCPAVLSKSWEHSSGLLQCTLSKGIPSSPFAHAGCLQSPESTKAPCHRCCIPGHCTITWNSPACNTVRKAWSLQSMINVSLTPLTQNLQFLGLRVG